MTTSLPPIARCRKCGREFIALIKGRTNDPWPPIRAAYTLTPCGGEIDRIPLPPPEPAPVPPKEPE